jgi:acetyltransferase-like isoleucine patch superfamily enzyme
MNIISESIQTPWKVWNVLGSFLSLPWVWWLMTVNGIPWQKRWSFYGAPIIQKHRLSKMLFGPGLCLRSSVRSNPLGPQHPVILCTMREGARIEIGENFGMTGGTICAATNIKIGNNVTVGANSSIVDTDFHPIHPERRLENPQDGRVAPVVIGDNVFIGMNCLILKGVIIGNNSIIGAGSVVTKDIPANTIVAGNPVVFVRAFV